MKSIKEKQLLVKWSKAMNEPIDDLLVEEVSMYEKLQRDILESVRKNSINDLTEASKVAEEIVNKVNDYPKPPTLDEVLSVLREEVDELVQAQEVPTETKPEPSVTSLAERAAELITKEARLEEKADSFQQPNPSLVPEDLGAIRNKLKFLEQWLAKVSMAGPGSGSYWLYDLGDTNYDIVKNPNNNDVLVYNSSNAKWEVGTVSNILGNRYHGSYFSNVNQTSANTSLSYFITINNTDFQNGFTTDGANIIAQHSGVYNLQFSNQLHYTGGGGSGNTVEIWLTKNGVNKEDTNTRVNLLSSSPYVVAAWNFLVSMDAGDKVALKWATDNLNIRFEASSGRVGPRVPSVIMTIAQV